MNTETFTLHISLSELWRTYTHCQGDTYVFIFVLLLSLFLYCLWKKFLCASGPPGKINEHIFGNPQIMTLVFGLIAGMVIPHFVGQAEQARQVQAGALIGELRTALESYKLDNGLYPTTEQGLNALVSPPVSTSHTGRHSVDRIPLDPWKNSFIYLSPGARNDRNRGYDLISRGPDGIESDDDTIFPGYPDIFAAAWQDDRIALQSLLDSNPDLIKAKDQEGTSLLHISLRNGSPETVKFLIYQVPHPPSLWVRWNCNRKF